MKKIAITILLALITNFAHSQDLIVTNNGDSINCKITRVKNENIYFTFKHKNEVRETLLPIITVKTHQVDYFKLTEIPNIEGKKNDTFQRFRFALNGGYSYRTAKVAENVPYDFRDYTKALKSGYHLGTDLTYFFTDFMGAGVKYQMFKSSNSLDGIYIENEYGERKYGKMSDDLTISFIGPSFSTRLLNHNKNNALILNLSLGYMRYVNNNVIVDSYKITGGTLGSSLDIGYDIGLSENVSLGLQLSFLSGTLFKYNLNDGVSTRTVSLEKNEYESLSRIDFSIGLRFHK